jgi:hypothetical protein
MTGEKQLKKAELQREFSGRPVDVYDQSDEGPEPDETAEIDLTVEGLARAAERPKNSDFFDHETEQDILFAKPWAIGASGRGPRKKPIRGRVNGDRVASNVLTQNMRAHDNGFPGALNAKLWAKWREAFAGECAYCGEQTPKDVIEHVIALRRDGANTVYNTVPACGRCNHEKGVKSLAAWLSRAQRDAFLERVVAAWGRMNEKT